MATAEELLATVGNEENYIVIDSDLRTMTFPASVKNIGVENDKDVHKLNFMMPRYFSGYDLSTFSIRINYLNAQGDGDMYVVTEPTVEEDAIYFTWLVGRHACLYKGAVTFIICLKLADGEGDVAQEYNTTLASLQVLPGLETEPTILENDYDIIEQLLLTIQDTNDKIKAVLDSGLTPEEITDFVTESKTLSARMDTFTSLPYGSTAGDAELTDIRVGADGTTYESAGSAVRGQVSDLKSDLDRLIDRTNIDLTAIEHRGAFLNLSANIQESTGKFAYTDPIPVYAGKKYLFTGQGTTIMTAICSCDASGNDRTLVFGYNESYVYETKEYAPTKDGYIMVCYIYENDYNLISIDDYENIGYYAKKIETNSENISNISESSINIIDMSNLEVGKNWTGASATNRAIIDINVLPNKTYYFLFPDNVRIEDNISLVQMNASSRISIKSDTVVERVPTLIQTTNNTYRICIQFATGSFTATEAIFENYEPYGCLGSYKDTAIDRFARKNAMPWENKKLVWLGTSIPAGGRYDVSNPNSYPIIVGELLGATVYNEAVGSSALHCKDPSRISASNPYGFLANFEAVSRCITNSLDEMEWIIDHYNDSTVFTQNVPSSLSDADKEFIRSCSWEIKLQKYFNANDFPDAWIIDHGHNDIPSSASEATYTAQTDMNGTQHNGYYSGGSLVTSTASSYLEFDVTNELYVWVSGTFGSWYDVYDIYDADGNNIGFTRNATQTDVSALKVNVINAKTLRVSNPNNLISTISVKRLTYPIYNSLYSYNGGFDFIVNKILTYNPRARIIMIGEYENQKYPTISENQLIASKRWEFPIYKQWENLGWSQQLILVDGEYKSMLNIIIPDNLHPHTDTTGYALKQMAKNIARWLGTIA